MTDGQIKWPAEATLNQKSHSVIKKIKISELMHVVRVVSFLDLMRFNDFYSKEVQPWKAFKYVNLKWINSLELMYVYEYIFFLQIFVY